MRRTWIILVLACFTFSGFLMAFGGEGGKREEYQKQTEARLKTLKQNLESTKVRSSVLREKTRAEFDEDLKAFKDKEKVAAARLQRLRAASEKTWDRGKAGVEAAMQDLSNQYEKLEARVKSP